jgi:uncharacterized protein (DUF2141 family)
VTSLILLLHFVLSGFFSAQTPTAPVRIHLDGLREGRGEILLALFNREVGFPDEERNAFRTFVFPARTDLVLESVPPGTYALALLHDLDGNKKMTFSFFGLPRDGYSSSPAGGARFSKPRFTESRFAHGSRPTDLRMKMHY